MKDEAPMTVNLLGNLALPLAARQIYESVLETVFADYSQLIESIPASGSATIDWWVRCRLVIHISNQGVGLVD